VATVTRVHANTGRIFVRLYVPGDHYRDRFRAEAVAAATAHSVAPAQVETYYTAQANGDGFRQAPGSDTARTEGDVVRRTIYWKTGAFAAINAGGFTEVTLDDDSTYTELLAAIDDILNANGAPITIWSTREEVTPSAGILDGYTDDLAVAFAPALLVPDYEGDCIRIRRSGDNAEADIGFDGTDLDRDAIATFCSPGDGFVKTWYDQSGNGNHATQTTTSAQPKIYDAATGVELENGKPAIYFDGTDDTLTFTEVSNIATLLLIAAPDDTTGNGTCFILGDNNTFNYHSGDAGVWLSSTFSAASVRNGSNYINGALTNLTTTTRTTAQVSLAMFHDGTATGSQLFRDRAGTKHWTGTAQAVIIYTADKSADRTAIESAINGYFNIYS
jgi:hypothetical protein